MNQKDKSAVVKYMARKDNGNTLNCKVNALKNQWGLKMLDYSRFFVIKQSWQ